MVPKRPVMIACVTFETAMVTEPLGFYGPGELYLFHFVTKNDPNKGSLYNEFYNETVRQITDRFPGIIIHEISNFHIWDFQVMVREISNIVTEVRKADAGSRILINASSGPNQFGMASLIVSQRNEGVTSFTVQTEEFTVPLETVKQIYYKDGKPVGLTLHCREPQEIPKFDLFVEDETLVRGLRVFIDMFDRGQHKMAQNVIAEMKKQGVWPREEGMEENMYYARHYKDAWLEKGWIEKDPDKGRKFVPTARGRLVAETFFTK